MITIDKESRRKKRIRRTVLVFLATTFFSSSSIPAIPKLASTFDETQITIIISKAKEAADNGNYENALAEIQKGLVDYPTSETLQEEEANYFEKSELLPPLSLRLEVGASCFFHYCCIRQYRLIQSYTMSTSVWFG